jgi:hypothetical protein
MVFDVHRQRLDGRIEMRPLRHRPTLEDAIQLETEVVMQPPGRMLLHNELPAGRRGNGFPSRRFGGQGWSKIEFDERGIIGKSLTWKEFAFSPSRR